MSAPYASVLLPTHDRHATLAHALASGQAQTVREIEILVACDGATPDVLAVARRAARSDPRIRVLDRPKGHNNGGEARAHALRLASSDRVLVLQDDDLWFPDHVATLGAALDDHDVVTAATLAVRPSGTVTAWTSNYASPTFREAARRTGYKLVFEAHYAFSLDSYRRLDVGWERVPGRANIKTLLECHLADPATRWASLTAPTALSFNSPVSEELNLQTRADVLQLWQDRIDAGLVGHDVMADAQWGGALWRGMDFLPPGPNEGLATYLARLGLHVGNASGLDHGLALPLSEIQLRHLEQCFRFVTGRAAEVEDWHEVVLDVMEPFAGPEPRCWAVALILNQTHGPDRACELVTAMLPSVDPEQRVLARALLAAVAAQAGYLPIAREQIELSMTESPLYRAYLHDFAGKVRARESQ